MIGPKEIVSFARVTGVDPKTVRDELVADGHFELLGSLGTDFRFVTTRQTILFSSPNSSIGSVIPAGQTLFANSDLTVNGRRRVSQFVSGTDFHWVAVADLTTEGSVSAPAPAAPVVGASPALSPAPPSGYVALIPEQSWFEKKVGPLPVYGWGLIGLGAAVIALVFSRSGR